MSGRMAEEDDVAQQRNDGPILHGTASTLRPLQTDDAERIADILRQPAVSQWWPTYDAERVVSELIEGPDTTAFAIELEEGDKVIGAILYVEEPSPDYRHATLDVFLHPEFHGKGLGTDSVRTLVRHLIHDRGHHRLAIDPNVGNHGAIKTYKRVGFREIGVARNYERGQDGQWHDCLLMDLTKSDLN